MARMVSKRLWWPLIGIVAAYAVAAQSFLIALGGFSLPATTSDSAPAFELCLHDAADGLESPAGNTKHSRSTDCPFCFAGTHHAVIAAPSAVFVRLYLEATETPWVADKRSLRGLPPHSIAAPRGPPFAA
jgi:hypothetical protein